MIFGKIDFINLLPFHVFMKKELRRSYQKLALHKRRGVPSQINKKLENGRIDAAVVSSIKSFKRGCTGMGIVADGEVLSVLVLPGNAIEDTQSDTSNALAKVLGIEGQVLIGDKALKSHLSGADAIDLGSAWKARHHLPFVYGRLCYTKDKALYTKLSRKFVSKRVKIPQYLLKKKSLESGVSPEDIRRYLTKIYYRIGLKEERSLRTFQKECRKRGLA